MNSYFKNLRTLFVFIVLSACFCLVSYASFWACRKFLSEEKKKGLQSFVSLSHAVQGSVIGLLSASLIAVLIGQKSDFKKSLSEESSYLRTLHIMGNTGDTDAPKKTSLFIKEYIQSVIDHELKRGVDEKKRQNGRLIIEKFYRWVHTKEPVKMGWKKSFYANMIGEVNALCHARSRRINDSIARVPSFILFCLSIGTIFLLVGLGFYIQKSHIIYDISLIICCTSLALIATVIFQLTWSFHREPPIIVLQNVAESMER